MVAHECLKNIAPVPEVILFVSRYDKRSRECLFRMFLRENYIFSAPIFGEHESYSSLYDRVFGKNIIIVCVTI